MALCDGNLSVVEIGIANPISISNVWFLFLPNPPMRSRKARGSFPLAREPSGITWANIPPPYQ
eukprot:46313-Prorocentrum_minimum.AAC.2